MDKIKQYKKQILNIVLGFLILEFVIFPGLTSANTILNILAGITLLLLVIWAGISLYEYIRNSDGFIDKKELNEAEQIWKQKVESKRKSKTK